MGRNKKTYLVKSIQSETKEEKGGTVNANWYGKGNSCNLRQMTWEIIAALISVITVSIAIGRVIANLSRTLTKLNCSVDSLNAALQSFIDRSEREHGQMNREISHLKKDVASHSLRISTLEYHEQRKD